MRFRASWVAEATEGDLVGPDVELDGVSIDSREIGPGQLFIALHGERDGHEFIADALAAGARAHLSSHGDHGGTAVVVEDTAAALTELGRAARRSLSEAVVAVTGSVGKTSTKDLTAAALGRSRRVHASVRSFNNELGVPLTLANAPGDTEVTVLEMGARGAGHIAHLCEVGRPTVGVVTTVEAVHTELFGDLASVARAKGELIEALPGSGAAVLNAMNPHVAAMADRTDARVILFGTETGDVRAGSVRLDGQLRPVFELSTPWGGCEVRLGVRGEHNVMNALAAASAALVCGVDLADVAEGLGQAQLSPWRMELTTSPTGALILNDSYNAGPASLEAALRALAQLDARRRIAVLGVMAELGATSATEHAKIGSIARFLGIRLIAVDAPDYGGEPCSGIDEAAEMLEDLGEGDAVLIKGSRVAGMERLAKRLMGT